MVILFDAHCHLQDERLEGQLEKIMTRARNAGVGKMVCCGTEECDWPSVVQVKEKYSDSIIPSFGLHPWHIKERSEKWFSKLEEFVSEIPSAIGEVGLDFALTDFSGEEQKEIFCSQLDLAEKYKRPVSVHCRKAFDSLIEIMEKRGGLKYGGIIHSYSGGANRISKLCDLGFSLSFSGSVTWSGNKRAKNSLLNTPSENLLLETDSPDILPAGIIGLNEPSNLILVAKEAASLFNLNEETVAQITSQNAEKIFDGLK